MTHPKFYISIKEIFEEKPKFEVEKYYIVKDREKNRNYSSAKINRLSISQEMKQNFSINEENEKLNLSKRKKYKSPEKIYKKNIFNFTKDSRFINKGFNIIDFEKQNKIINNENQTKIKKLRDLTKFEKELKNLREAKTYESQKYSNLNNNDRKPPIFHINISNINDEFNIINEYEIEKYFLVEPKKKTEINNANKSEEFRKIKTARIYRQCIKLDMNFIRKEGNEKLEKLNNKKIFKNTKVEKVQDYSPKKNFNSKNIENTKDSMEELTQTTFDNSLSKDINKK